MLQVLLHLIQKHTEDLRKQFDIPTQVGRIVTTGFGLSKPTFAASVPIPPIQPQQLAPLLPQPIETAPASPVEQPAASPVVEGAPTQPAAAESTTPTASEPATIAPAPDVPAATAEATPTTAEPAQPAKPTLLRVSEADKKKREGAFPVLATDIANCVAEIPTAPDYVPNPEARKKIFVFYLTTSQHAMNSKPSLKK